MWNPGDPIDLLSRDGVRCLRPGHRQDHFNHFLVPKERRRAAPDFGNLMSSRRVEPVRRDPALDHWVGMWIAVKDGEVVAAAHNSHELVRMVIEMGPRGAGAVAQFVPQPDDRIVIGVG